MDKKKIGISDIVLYIPFPRIEIDTIINTRIAENPAIAPRLHRAVEITGQKAIRFPDVFEDSATIAANATKRLLDTNNGKILSDLRYLVVGTETSVDMSKPVSAYVMGMLERAGYPIPLNISNFQIQHACAGGTLAMLSVAALLQADPRKNEKGIVVCSDIARYDSHSTAEITQGAGAASLLIEHSPRLIELNIETQGYASADVDDFFRPLGSTTAKVKGGYSVECYYRALDSALYDHAKRRGKALREIIEEVHMFVFHVPFAQMAVNAVKRLLNRHLNLHGAKADAFLNARGFYEALEATTQVGNIYTGALYLNMVAQLVANYKIYGNDIVAKKMLIISYGSGNTMLVISGQVSEMAPKQLALWNISAQLNHGRQASWDEYECWLHRLDTKTYTLTNNDAIPHNTFILDSVREDGYRRYQYRE